MQKRTAIRRPIFALAVLVAIALAVWGLWPRTMEVESGEVDRGPLSVTLVEEGRTRVRHRYVISAPLEGTLDRVELEPGDTVQAGQALAMLRPTSSALLDPASRAQAQAQATAADRQLAAAQASVSAATAEQRRSRAALQRAERLVAYQLIARSELDTLSADAAAADASLRASHSATPRVHSATRPGPSSHCRGPSAASGQPCHCVRRSPGPSCNATSRVRAWFLPASRCW